MTIFILDQDQKQCSECEDPITDEVYSREPEFPVCDICDAISDPT